LYICAALSTLEREWRTIAGEALAQRSSLKSFEEGVLVVSVTNQSALQDISFRKTSIRKEILRKLSLNISDIRAEIGKAAGKSASHKTDKNTRRQPRRSLSVDERAVDSLSADIMSRYSDIDPELARRIARCRIMCDKKIIKDVV
jgi:hypothetical protein